MGKIDRAIYVIFVIFALFVLSGFYFIFDRISNLKSDIKNLEFSIELLKKDIALTPPEAPPLNEPPANTSPPPENQEIKIPTAIIFEASSSPLLSPQTKITITIENVAKAPDGTISVNIKAFTAGADAYSALEPRNLFELVNFSGDNQKPIQVNGSFDSIPPKSTISGSIIFKINATQNNLILQIGGTDSVKFFEFNFTRKTYKETAIG